MWIAKRYFALLAVGLLCLAAAAPVTWRASDTGSLLGKSPDQIIDRFGVPHEISAGVAVLKFMYEDESGKRARFAFHADVAVAVPDDGFQPALITRPPTDKPYDGQRVEMAVLRAGNAARVNVGPGSISLEYANGMEMKLCQGRVMVGMR